MGCHLTAPPSSHPLLPWSALRLPTPADTANETMPMRSAREAIECQPNTAQLAGPSSPLVRFEGSLSDTDTTIVTSTVVTLSGNPNKILDGIYGFQGWMCQRPQFANTSGGVLYHDGEHWKVRAGAIPPGQAAASESFAAWIRSSELLPPEGDWLNFSSSGDISSITRVSVSIRGQEVRCSPSPPTSATSIDFPAAAIVEPARLDTGHVPTELIVVSLSKQVAFAGRYQLISNQNPNGCPVWQHQDHERYLYSGVNGKWHFGANPEKEKGFLCSRGFILHPSRHNGVMPSQMPRGEWKAHTGMTHETDPSIEVNEPAEVNPSAQPEPRRPTSRSRAETPEPTREPAALSPDQAVRPGRPPRPGQSIKPGAPS